MRKLVYIPLIVGVLGFGGIVLAETDTAGTVEKPEKVEIQASSSEQKMISTDAAIEKALDATGGAAEEVELEHDDGQVYYEVEIEDGHVEFEVKVDAFTGSILEIEED